MTEETVAPVFDGNYHCTYCGRVFRVADRVAFLGHQKECKERPSVLSDKEISGRIHDILFGVHRQEELEKYIKSVIQQARQEGRQEVFREVEKHPSYYYLPIGEHGKTKRELVGYEISKGDWQALKDKPHGDNTPAEH